jgi:acetoin utilization protein AcuB
VVPSQAVQTGQEGQYIFVVKPDLTVESRPVVVGRKLVGILTIVDILAAFIQLLGILKSSCRIDMILGGKPHAFEEVSALLRNHRAEIISVGMSNHKDRKKRVYYFRVGKCPVTPIVNELKKKGYKVLSVVE